MFFVCVASFFLDASELCVVQSVSFQLGVVLYLHVQTLVSPCPAYGPQSVVIVEVALFCFRGRSSPASVKWQTRLIC